MKTMWTIVLLAGFLSASEVRVYVSEDAGITPAVLQSARAEATWMFAKIGVPIRWREGLPPQNLAAGVLAVRIDFSTRTPPQAHPGALAYAHPFANGVASITILYDRIRFAAERQTGFEHRLLAHVLAHEIGHVLAATNHHSESGVMKARWTPEDFARMSKAPLPFTATDRELIAGRASASRP